jgi:hypothetical protein
MNRILSGIFFILAIAPAAAAQTAVVEKYRTQYPTPLTREQLLALERAVAGEVRGGLLIKPDGSNCGGYACDIVCFSDAVLFDILEDSDGEAKPQWLPKENPRHYHCELVPPPAPEPPPVVTPPAPTVPASLQACDLSTIQTQLTRIEAGVQQTDADVREFRAAVAARWKAISTFALKYVAPAITAWVTARHTN